MICGAAPACAGISSVASRVNKIKTVRLMKKS
jgi:hypothetical protein